MSEPQFFESEKDFGTWWELRNYYSSVALKAKYKRAELPLGIGLIFIPLSIIPIFVWSIIFETENVFKSGNFIILGWQTLVLIGVVLGVVYPASKIFRTQVKGHSYMLSKEFIRLTYCLDSDKRQWVEALRDTPSTLKAIDKPHAAKVFGIPITPRLITAIRTYAATPLLPIIAKELTNFFS